MSRWINILLILCLASSIWSQNTIFNQRKQQYLATNGEGVSYLCEKMWAWLENIKNGQIDGSTYKVFDVDGVERPVNQVIHNIIRCWGTSWKDEGYPPYVYAWKWSFWTAHVALYWIYKQYGDVISSADYQFIEELYKNYVQSPYFAPQQPNQCTHDMTGRYLFLENHRYYEVVYSDNAAEFEYGGRFYYLGQKYNAYQLARDWLFHAMEESVDRGHVEFDSPNYTHALVHSFLSLYHFSEDAEMKRRAKMMVDFFMLETILDFSGNQWTGAFGRTYADYITRDKSVDYTFAFWDVILPSREPSLDIFVSDYRLPDVIWDIGDLNDEPENYYHINMEGNLSIMSTPNTGKWNYVTKFYSMGGECNGDWQLCINSEDNKNTTRRWGVPFRLWINNLEEGEDISNPTYYQQFIEMGRRGYQYKNSMFILNGFYLHYALHKNEFDVDEQIGSYRFFKEGRTMVAIRFRPDKKTACLEVAVEGLDYPSLQDFQTAVLNNCDLDGGKFINTRGDWVGADLLEGFSDKQPIVRKGGVGDFVPVFDFTFKRLQCVDHLKRYIVRWQDDVMTVRRHGRQIVYNFNNWTYTESTYEQDLIAPEAPTGLNIQPGL
ncbi:hypothetical protein JW835_09135 [bacterium]|nr:hypothetical protein [bacterium]